MNHRQIENCRLCGSHLEKKPNDKSLLDPALGRCEGCGTCQLSFVVESQADLYPTFDQKTSFFYRLIQKLLSAFYFERRFSMRRAKIQFGKRNQTLDKRPKLLDVGCGAGDFIYHVNGFFDVVGQEPFSLNREKYPDLRKKIHQVSLSELPFPAETFDVITFWHSLEHMEDAANALQCARRLLKPDGRLWISIPNINSFQARLFRNRWFHLVIPRHVFHFNRETLSRLIVREGFDITHFDTLTLEYGLSGWIQSFLNGLYEKDLFYEWIKNRGEFEKSGATGKALKVYFSLILSVALLPLFFLFEIICGYSGQGAIMNVAAIKKK